MQKTAYEMRISDWSSDVCSSDLTVPLSARNNDSTVRSRRRLKASTDSNTSAASAAATTASKPGNARSNSHCSASQNAVHNANANASLPASEKRRRGAFIASSTRQTHPLHAPVQRLPAHTEFGGGLTDVARGPPHRG